MPSCSESTKDGCESVLSVVGGIMLFMQSRKTKRKVGTVLVALLLVNSYFQVKKINIILLLLHLGLLNI